MMQVFSEATAALEEAQFCADSERIPYCVLFDEAGFAVCPYDEVTDLSLILERCVGV
jgi:hypothetical protein